MWLLADTAPPSPVANSWLYVLVALIGGGLLNVLWQVYRRWRHGASEDALVIAKAAQDQADTTTRRWTEYKIELQDAKEQIAQYLRELVSVNRELGQTTARLSSIEEELRQSRGENARLRDELADARARRDELLNRIHELQDRIQALEPKPDDEEKKLDGTAP